MHNNEPKVDQKISPLGNMDPDAITMIQRLSKEGKSEELREALEDLAAEIAFSNHIYRMNASLLHNPRLKPDRAAEIQREQQQTIERIKRIILQEAGIPTAEALSELEQAREAVLAKVSEMDLGETTSDQILKRLDILHTEKDAQGNEVTVFHYPNNLFPESVNEKWHLYMEAVESHMQTADDVLHGYKEQQDFNTADRARNIAHNAVAGDIHKILGLDTLTDWDFKKTRDLIGKMRDHKFGGDTRESAITGGALRRALGTDVLKKLAQRS